MKKPIAPLAMFFALSLASAQAALAEPAKHTGAARVAKPASQANDQHASAAATRDDTAIKVKTPSADAYTCSGGTCETQVRGGNAPTPPKSSYTCSGGTCE
jgi:hypothetical protein